MYKTRKNLDWFSGLYDFNLFNRNVELDLNIDSENNLLLQRIQCHYYSPHSFSLMKTKPSLVRNQNNLSILHNNIRSIHRNLENFETHLLDELDCHFGIIGLTETKITTSKELTNCSEIQGYDFQFVPTPLSSGGVGLFVDSSLNYEKLDKVSTEAFQALWIEIFLAQKKSVLVGIIYRQH